MVSCRDLTMCGSEAGCISPVWFCLAVKQTAPQTSGLPMCVFPSHMRLLLMLPRELTHRGSIAAGLPRSQKKGMHSGVPSLRQPCRFCSRFIGQFKSHGHMALERGWQGHPLPCGQTLTQNAYRVGLEVTSPVLAGI